MSDFIACYMPLSKFACACTHTCVHIHVYLSESLSLSLHVVGGWHHLPPPLYSVLICTLVCQTKTLRVVWGEPDPSRILMVDQALLPDNISVGELNSMG